MKSSVFLIMFFVAACSQAQQMAKVHPNASTYPSISYCSQNDDLVVFYDAQYLNFNGFNSPNPFRKATFTNNVGSVIRLTDTLISSNQANFIIKEALLTSGNKWFKAGGMYDSLGRFSVWYKIGGREDYDSLSVYPLYDSSYTSTTIHELKVIGNYAYIFGGLRMSQYPFAKAFIIKQSLISNQYSMNEFYCYSSFCFFEDAIYDSSTASFVVTSPARIGNSIPPYGAGLAKIDTNLNLIHNTAQVISSNYQTHVINPPNPYHRQAVIEPSANGNFLAVGPVINFVQSFSATPNPNSSYYYDMAVAVRSMNNLQEIGPAFAYGKIDTSDRSAIGEQPFKRVENDLFYIAASKRFNNPAPERWDTDLALFGLNNQGQKHWEYYLPLNDYCYIQDIHATPSGGMWFVAQCSELVSNPIGYDFFTKVGFIDSVYYWPRIGAVGLATRTKKAEDLVVYPNPATDFIKVKQYGLVQQLSYKVYDLQGRLLVEKAEQNHIVQIDMSELKPAIYLLRVEDQQGSLVKEEKVIKR